MLPHFQTLTHARNYFVARFAKREREFKILARLAEGRQDDVQALSVFVGQTIFDACDTMTSIHAGIYAGIGYCEANNFEGEKTIAWEAPVGYLVNIRNRPTLALGVEFRGKVLCIRQLQGVRGAPIPPELRHWPKLLVKACMEYALRLGVIEEVRLYAADQTLFFHYPVFEDDNGQKYADRVKDHQQRISARYNGTARKLKFASNERYYVWRNPTYTRPG